MKFNIARMGWLGLALSLASVACTSADDDAASGTNIGATGGIGSTSAGMGAGGSAVTDVGAAGGAASGGSRATASGTGGSSMSAGGSGAGGSSAQAGNDAGSGGTGGSTGMDAGPPVDLPNGVSGLFPLPGAKSVCVDTPLRLTFAGAPSVSDSGMVQVFDAAQPGQAVATIDFAVTNLIETIGGQAFNLPRQVYVDGNDVVIYPEGHALAYGKTYYVTVSAGAISGPGNAAFSISDSSAWTFTTASAATASATSLKVALDGKGDFCSLQGALDAVPNNNNAKVTIDIGVGTYHGVVYFSGKHNVTVHGADRKSVILSGTNNNNLNPSTKGRALIGADNANGLVVENLTIHNLTPQDGSQAEALRLQGCDQCIVRDADILSLQDTLLWSGRIYAHNCYVAGNVDFVWGTGVVYFDACEIKTVGRSGPIVQSRNAPGAYGYVFVDSKISSDPGLTGSTLARIDAAVYPGSHVAYVNCTLGSHISSAGWTITGAAATSALRFWEYQSKDSAGTAIDTGGRLFGSQQISVDQAASMRDKATVLGGWVPN